MSLDELSDDIALAPTTTTAAPADDRTAVAIRRSIQTVESSLSELDKIVAGLNALREKYPVDLVYDVRTTKGMAEAIAHRAAWRDPRIAVEKFRKTAKQPVLALGKDIDARAAWITEQLLEGEVPIHEQIKAEEDRKAAERAAKEAAEFGRIVKMQEAVGEIAMQAMVAGKSSAEIAARLDAMKTGELDPAVFQEMMPDAIAARAAAITKLEQALKAAQWDEEQARKRAEEEAARRAKQAEEDAERARVAKAQAEEAEALRQLKAKIDRENAELEARAAAFRAEQEAARKAAEAALAPSEPIKGAEADIPQGAAVEASAASAPPSVRERTAENLRATLAGIAAEPVAVNVPAQPEPDTRPDLNVGAINERLGFTLTRAFIETTLGVACDRTEKGASYWRASKWPTICDALVTRIADLRSL